MARSKRRVPKTASAAMASRSARGIFLYPRAFVVRNVAMTKPVATSHTDTMGRALAQPDVRNVSYTPRQTDCEFPQRAVLAYKHIADEMREEHRRRVLGE